MSVERRGDKWRVRYLDGDRHRSRTFDLKADAQAFDQETRRRKQRGTLADADRRPRRRWTRMSSRRGRRSKPPCSLPTAAGSTRGRTTRTSAPRSAPCRCTRSPRRSSPAGRPGSSPRSSGTRRSARPAMSCQGSSARPSRRKSSTVTPCPPSAPRPRRCATSRPSWHPRVSRPYAPPAARGAPRWCLYSPMPVCAHKRRASCGGVTSRTRTLIASARKTRRRRSVRLLDPLAQDLREWRMLSGRPADDTPVFPGRDGEVMTATAFSDVAPHEWRAAVKAAGIAPGVPYVLRHSLRVAARARGPVARLHRTAARPLGRRLRRDLPARDR